MGIIAHPRLTSLSINNTISSTSDSKQDLLIYEAHYQLFKYVTAYGVVQKFVVLNAVASALMNFLFLPETDGASTLPSHLKVFKSYKQNQWRGGLNAWDVVKLSEYTKLSGSRQDLCRYKPNINRTVVIWTNRRFVRIEFSLIRLSVMIDLNALEILAGFVINAPLLREIYIMCSIQTP